MTGSIGSIATALSGLTAQAKRLDASASNIANLRSTGTLPRTDGTAAAAGPAGRQAYEPTAVVQADAGPGTRATFTPITPAYLPEYSPDDPAADADGLVAAPNVDPATERLNQMAASRAYGANLSVLRTQDEMLTTLLDSKI